MPTEPDCSGHVLRVALIAPLVYGAAVWLDVPLPFVAGMLFATLGLQLPAPPPLRNVVLLALLLALLPMAFAGITSVLQQYPYLMLGVIGLALFHAFRLQAVPATALVGVLLQTFAIMLPLITGKSVVAGEAVSHSFALNGVLAVAGIYFAFAVFPARVQGEPAPVAPAVTDGWERTRDAAVATLVMLPPVAILLAFNLTSATRILLTIAIVLASLNQRDVRQTGIERLVSTLTAGAVALAATALYAIWPAPGAAMVAMAFLGLLVVPYAFKGPLRGVVALAVPLVWILLGIASENAASKTVEWCLYSAIGVLYAIWARALTLRVIGGSDGLRTAQ
jgi:hypothetical protein